MAIIREYKAKLEENGLMILRESELYRTENKRIRSTIDAARILHDVFELGKEAEENVLCICMNAQGQIIGAFRSCSGSISACHFDVGSIAKKCLLLNAVSCIIAHNHPGGTCTPSDNDIDATKRVKDALKLIGINLLDHIIIPSYSKNYYSFAEERAMP